MLQTGALPSTWTWSYESPVSATLGPEALDEGIKAAIIGLALIVLFLLVYYRLLGRRGGSGLGVYGVIFFALIKLIPITLTLPGIAGLC